MKDFRQALNSFLAESFENLDHFDRDLVKLEENPTDRDTLALVFRTIHTIKGTSGSLGLSKLEKVAQAGENLLFLLWDGQIPLDSKRITGLLGMGDAIREVLGHLENTGTEGDTDYTGLVKTLTALRKKPGEKRPAKITDPIVVPGEASAPKDTQDSTQAESPAETVSPPAATPPNMPVESPQESRSAGTLFDAIGGKKAIGAVVKEFFRRVRRDSKLKTYFPKAVVERLRKIHTGALTLALGGSPREGAWAFWTANKELKVPKRAFNRLKSHLAKALDSQGVAAPLAEQILAVLDPSLVKGTSPAPLPAQTSTAPSTSPAPSAGVVEPPSAARGNGAPEAPAGGNGAGAKVGKSNIRVDVDLLDQLMNLVGELVLARNQILQHTTKDSKDASADSAMTATSQHLNLITTELQEGVMKTRMQPIGTIWEQFPGVVRDSALSGSKQIRLEMDGEDTELDRTIIDGIRDPLTHLVRLAADHGIEQPAERLAGGKPGEGRIHLRAFHEGGQVNIEITDDGRGINPQEIKNEAASRNLVPPDQLARISDREALSLIFLPGFSTGSKVSNLSGCAAGLDVVKTNIEKIGGTVDIYSTLGQGTTFKMKIPLTLAIIPALIAACGNDRYAIPQVSLLELVRLGGDEAAKGIEMIHGAPVYRLRGSLLPLVYLNREFDLGDGHYEDGVNIIVLQAEERTFGLVVEGIHDTEEIVVKPLGKMLKGISAFAGATIMGDGRVALILDVLGLAQKASVVSEVGEHAAVETTPEVHELADNRQTFLVFEVGKDRRVAMPLSLVARLEEFQPSQIETTGEQEVVQYRGEIMPLIRLSGVLRATAPEGNGSDTALQVVVHSDQGRSVGLAVDRILDIVEESVAVERNVKQGGILGSVVIQNRTTDLLDVQGIILAADPNFYQRPTAAEAGA